MHQKGELITLLPKASKRNVYAHDLADYEDDEFYNAYNLDSDIVDLQAKKTSAIKVLSL